MRPRLTEVKKSQHSGRSIKTKLTGARQPINFGIKDFRRQSIESIEEELETASMDDDKFLESVLGQTGPKDAE